MRQFSLDMYDVLTLMRVLEDEIKFNERFIKNVIAERKYPTYDIVTVKVMESYADELTLYNKLSELWRHENHYSIKGW